MNIATVCHIAGFLLVLAITMCLLYPQQLSWHSLPMPHETVVDRALDWLIIGAIWAVWFKAECNLRK